jgi:hypothetical protein
VVGYCPPSQFDTEEAVRMMVEGFDAIAAAHPDCQITIVSGLSNVGVLAIAYNEAVRRGWRTVGIASKRVLEHEIFPVDEQMIVGETWGDESPAFLAYIHALIRIGGGKQSYAEAEEMRRTGREVLEYDLPRLN